ncbi:MAG: sigma 54-interacting transcriptional regulator [Planctomycetes bacterium]|nr:sigma 54-interacting transcriptional regulator [Planctomycetota bacterium]
MPRRNNPVRACYDPASEDLPVSSAPACLVHMPAELKAGILDALAALGRSLGEEVDPRTFLDDFSRLLKTWVPHDRLVVAALSEDEQSFTILAEQGGPIGAIHAGHYTNVPGPRARHPVKDWGVAPVFRGQAMVAGDLTADPRFAAQPGERPILDAGIRSGIAAPLVHGGRVVGALIATSVIPNVHHVDHLPIFCCLADIVAPFVQGAVLLQRDRIRRRRLKVLADLTSAIAGTLEFEEVFAKLAEAVRRAIDFESLGVLVVSPDGRDVISLAEVDHVRPDVGPPERIPGDQFTLGPRVLGGETAIVFDAPEELDARLAGDRWILESGARSVLAVPLWMRERVGGVLYFAHRESRWYDSSDEEIGRAIALQVALAIQHQRLAEEHQRLAATEYRAKKLERRVETLQQELEARFGFDGIVGRSPELRAALDKAARVAPTETTVLVTGESGTGKELVAHAIHAASPRREGPFVALNCAAIPESLLESELFGHERGAFTGADRARPGKIESASGGTLFLDEIGELSPSAQAKLLRVLQEREFTRVGSNETRKADVRIVAATNRELLAEVGAGRFREDLYYRLAVFAVHLPPLRERGDDVRLLAEHFLAELGRRMGKNHDGLSREARDRLLSYPWPGNIRELSNAIERALILSDGGAIRPDQLGLPAPKAANGQAVGAQRAAGLSGPLPEVERRLVIEALERASGNKVRAAASLGVTRSQLYTLLKKHKIEAP